MKKAHISPVWAVLLCLVLLGLLAGYLWYRQPIRVQRTVLVTSAGGEERDLTADLTLRRYLLRPLSVQGTLTVDGRTFSYVPYDRPHGFFQRLSAEIREKLSPPDTVVFKEVGPETLQILYLYDFYTCPTLTSVHFALPHTDGVGWTEFFGPVLHP